MKQGVFRMASRLKATQSKAEWTEKLGSVTAYTFGASTCTVLFDGEDPTEDPDDAILFKRPYLPNVGDRVVVRKTQGRKVIDGVVGVLPIVRVYRSAAVNYSNGAVTGLAWDAESWKSVASMHDNSTNPNRLIAPVAGIFTVNVTLQFAANATGSRSVLVRKNAAGNGAGGTSIVDAGLGAAGSFAHARSIAVDWEADVTGDYVEVFYFQNSGGALAAITGSDRTYAEMWLKTA